MSNAIDPMISQEQTRHGATAAIAAFALRTRPAAPGHRDAFARTLLDTLGCALAGHSSPTMAALRRWAGTEPAQGRATDWATGERTAATRAALLNGTAGHALDWDDVAPVLVLHPSTVLLPALIAVAEETDASGCELVEAHDVGAAVLRAVTVALPGRFHYESGWHSTATAGRIAATAALCRLRRLTLEQSRNALGIVASLASGSLANFGTMTKPLHAGVAARDAVMATGLAAAGFTANDEQLESADGFFPVFGDPGTQDLSVLGRELERWRTDWTAEWAIKRFPSCYATHRAAEAAISLHHDVAGREPRRVTVTVAPGQLRPLLDHWPRNGQEAKFSMAYVVATALLAGDLRITHFTPGALADRQVASLARRVVACESAEAPCGGPADDGGYAVVQVELADGSVLAGRTDYTKGDARSPLSDSEVRGKFLDCCEIRGMAQDHATALADAIADVPAWPGLGRLHRHLTHPLAAEFAAGGL
jgi:2-methylcitrate dehydratase PrpD